MNLVNHEWRIALGQLCILSGTRVVDGVHFGSGAFASLELVDNIYHIRTEQPYGEAGDDRSQP